MTPATVLKTIFDQAAEDYDAIRPGYPETLIDDVVMMSELPTAGRILEIGCGTGQATLAFAVRGYPMVCLDIGAALAVRARTKCTPYPEVQIHTVAFETWPPEDSAFDLVLSATTFHWIDPAIGYPKAARVLKPSGSLAVMANLHPTPYTDFFQAVQKVYRRVVPEWRDPSQSPSTDERVNATAAQIGNTGLFEQAVVQRYPWSHVYTREEYLKLLNTYSEHRNLEANRRQRLFTGIGEVIDHEYGGTITRPYLAVLYLARKKILR